MKQSPRFEVESSVRIPRKDQVETATGKANVKPSFFNPRINIQDLTLKIPNPVFLVDTAYRTISDGILNPRADEPSIFRDYVYFDYVCSGPIFNLQAGSGILKPMADTAGQDKTGNQKKSQD